MTESPESPVDARTATASAPDATLAGRRVALAESRELDLLADMLARAGADILRCPLVAIRDAPDPGPVEDWIGRAIDGRFDDVVLYTGEGVRRLLGFAERAGLRTELVAALARTRKVTRGPKPVRALREAGLVPDLTAASPTTEGIMATLDRENLTGRTVAVQAYGDTANADLLAWLESRGAAVDVVAPYRYADDSEDRKVEALIRAMAEGTVDAIAFTASPQVTRLGRVAARAGLGKELDTGLARTRVAAVGPVVAAELGRAGRVPDAVAEAPFSLKPLVRTIAGLFEAPERPG